MNVINELKVKRVQLSSLKRGDVFMNDMEVPFMKLEGTGDYNCVNLKTGWRHDIEEHLHVIPVGASLLIKPHLEGEENA